MKKRLLFAAVILFLAIALVGCGKKEETNNTVTVNDDTVVDANED